MRLVDHSSNLCLQDTVTPAFDKIQAEHVVPGIRALLTELNDNLDELEKTVKPTWEGLVEPLERLSDKIERTWGAVSHLKVRKPCVTHHMSLLQGFVLHVHMVSKCFILHRSHLSLPTCAPADHLRS